VTCAADRPSETRLRTLAVPGARRLPFSSRQLAIEPIGGQARLIIRPREIKQILELIERLEGDRARDSGDYSWWGRARPTRLTSSPTAPPAATQRIRRLLGSRHQPPGEAQSSRDPGQFLRPARIPRECFYRNQATGRWELFEGIASFDERGRSSGNYLHFLSGPDPESQSRYISVDDWLGRLRSWQTEPDPDPHTLLWIPSARGDQPIYLAKTIPNLLSEVGRNPELLRTVNWRDFEAMVAALLESDGWEVRLTKRTHDGGRDVIARAITPDGTPFMMAVSAKQQAVFSRRDAVDALYENRAFPLIMLATSGRFSAGVLQLRSQSENRLRLELRSGEAVIDWINRYRHAPATGIYAGTQSAVDRRD